MSVTACRRVSGISMSVGHRHGGIYRVGRRALFDHAMRRTARIADADSIDNVQTYQRQRGMNLTILPILVFGRSGLV